MESFELSITLLSQIKNSFAEKAAPFHKAQRIDENAYLWVSMFWMNQYTNNLPKETVKYPLTANTPKYNAHVIRITSRAGPLCACLHMKQDLVQTRISNSLNQISRKTLHVPLCGRFHGQADPAICIL
eukprot:ANDGO_07418.mRNA.1 hypothetical protein